MSGDRRDSFGPSLCDLPGWGLALKTAGLACPGGSGYDGVVHLALPSDAEAWLSPESVALHLAIGLFVTEEATLGQASAVAGMPQGQFLKELGIRRIPIHLGAEEQASDLAAVAEHSPR